jgi:hypothetical protein
VIQNFDEVKRQLGELIDLVNGFKSEAVQLRVVEALLANVVSGGAVKPAATSEQEAHQTPQRRASRRPAQKKANGFDGAPPKSTARKTPKRALEDLSTEGYFSQHRLVGDIAKYLKVNRALTFKTSSLQVALNRLVQDKQMQRGKNAEGQFEYWK